MEELLQKIDEAIAASDRAMAGATRGEALVFDIRARADWKIAELFDAIYRRVEETRVGIDIQTPKGVMRVRLDGGVCVRPPDGNWLLPVEVYEEENRLGVRALLLDVLKAAQASPEEAEVKVYPV